MCLERMAVPAGQYVSQEDMDRIAVLTVRLLLRYGPVGVGEALLQCRVHGFVVDLTLLLRGSETTIVM